MKSLILPTISSVAVIGGGPAGLRAAEVAASAGLRVTLYDAKPSVGRKFLVAGKGGLNITHGEALDRFQTRYSGPGQPSGFGRDCSATLIPERCGNGRQDWAWKPFRPPRVGSIPSR